MLEFNTDKENEKKEEIIAFHENCRKLNMTFKMTYILKMGHPPFFTLNATYKRFCSVMGVGQEMRLFYALFQLSFDLRLPYDESLFFGEALNFILLNL